MKILVTGANGYLGRGIVKKLLDDGQEVVATDFNTEMVDKRAHRINCNLFECLEPYLFFDKPDVVLHLAWKNGFVHNADSHLNDLPLHVTFLKKMVDSGIGRLAVMGTVHEIGFFEGEVNENTPCNPLSMYGIAKNALRQVALKMCRDNNVVFQWLRGFYIVGNVTNGSSVFSKLYLAAMEGEKLFPFTSGKNKYDFLDYDVFCMQVASTVEQESVVGIINICSGVPQTLSWRVEKFIKDNALNIKLDYGKFPDREYDSKGIWGDNKKIAQIVALRNKK